MGIVSRQQGLSPRAAYPRLSEGASVLGPWEDAPEKAWQARRMAVYAAMVEAMDRGICRILDKLRERGLERDTVVIFLSDNGGCAENIHPDCYDVPSKTRDGRAIHVGNDPRFMPGSQEVFQSYGPALNGKPLERGPLFWEHEGNRAVRLGDWKLLAGHGENWQLYNIAADCAEASDLSAANPGRVEELKALYDAWAAHCGVEPWPVRR